MAVKWILHTDPIYGVSEYIKVIQNQPDGDTIAEIDTNFYVPTTYHCNDYILRRYLSIKLGVIRTTTGHSGGDPIELWVLWYVSLSIRSKLSTI